MPRYLSLVKVKLSLCLTKDSIMNAYAVLN
jgi:hypothetical protein